jgi:tetratricopeptide (TPR) repeat protein
MNAEVGDFRPREAAVLQHVAELVQRGRFPQALVSARELVARAPESPDAHHLLALCLAETGDMKAAEGAFERALALAPDQILVLSNFASLLRRVGRPRDALPHVLRASQLASGSAKAWLELANTASLAGDPALARRAALRSLELEPEAVPALQVLGNAARAEEDLVAAEHAYASIVSRAPTHRLAWLGLGDSQRRAGRADLSVMTYEMARAYLDSPELDDAMAGALLDAGRVEDAIAQARRLTERHPQFAPGWTTLANLAWEYAEPEAGEVDLARFRKAVEEQPQNTVLRLALLRFLLATRQAEAALVQVRSLPAGVNDWTFALLEAQALALLGENAAAGRLHAAIHAAGGNRDPACLNAYARYRLRTGRADIVSELASAVLQLDPANQEALAYLGTALRLLDDPREHWLCDYDRLVGFVEVQPPSGYRTNEVFLGALQDALEPLHRARREPIQQSLRGGSQTPGRLFGRPVAVLHDACHALRAAVRSWIASLPDDPTHPFLGRKRPDVRMGGSWSVKLRAAGRHSNHIHSEGWLSSAFYVVLPPIMAAPDDAAASAGAIQFGQPPEDLALALSPRRVLQPQPGKLALFPSYLWHGTIPFEGPAPRLTIAFDMKPGGARR